jgi:hypothetical protein
MNSNGLFLGLVIIGAGVLIIFPATGRDDEESISLGSRGGFLINVRSVKLCGKIIMLIGSIILILSLLFP